MYSAFRFCRKTREKAHGASARRASGCRWPRSRVARFGRASAALGARQQPLAATPFVANRRTQATSRSVRVQQKREMRDMH